MAASRPTWAKHTATRTQAGDLAACYWGFRDHSSWTAKSGHRRARIDRSAWAVCMAPQSNRRAREVVPVGLEVVIFGAATAALAASTGAALAIIFSVAAGTNAVSA
jgi:Protein of unknown function (DUF2568)